MTQLTKVSTKPDHLTQDVWRSRLIEAHLSQSQGDGYYCCPNLYAACFVDLGSAKFVTTIIFNDETNREAQAAIARGFEKLHNLLTQPA